MSTHQWAPVTGRSSLPVLLSAWGLTGSGVEVGTHRGEYAETVLHNWPGTLHCVDPWSVPKGYEEQARLLPSLGGGTDRAEDYEECVRRLARFGGRAVLLKTTSRDALDGFAPASLDFVYVDGDHRPNQVSFDLVNWYHRVKPGGLLAGHDYLTLNEPSGRPGVDVKFVVDSFAATKGLPVNVVREFTDQPWSWYLVKPFPPAED